VQDSLPDIGADEYSTGVIRNFVLTPEDVGPFADLEIPVAIEKVKKLRPESYYLLNNYPNPFNPLTVIEYEIPMAERVLLVLFDVNGRRIKELFNTHQLPGRYRVQLRADVLASGVYFCKLKTAHVVLNRKIIKVR